MRYEVWVYYPGYGADHASYTTHSNIGDAIRFASEAAQDGKIGWIVKGICGTGGSEIAEFDETGVWFHDSKKYKRWQ